MTAPLADVRVLELTSVLGGPLAARLLADLGADVIKIEQPGSGDASRKLGPYFLGGESAYFLGFNRNKRSAALDLRSEAGLDAFYALAAKSDVVLDNFRPGVLDRLGLGYDAATSAPCSRRRAMAAPPSLFRSRGRPRLLRLTIM